MNNEDPIIPDIRMFDFGMGKVLYENPTENVTAKFNLLRTVEADLSEVITVIGGNWPYLYVLNGAHHVKGFDINPKQIEFFSKQSLKDEKLKKFIEEGRLEIEKGDITSLHTRHPHIFQNLTVFELTNVLDYLSPRIKYIYIEEILHLLPDGATLSLSSRYGEFINKLANFYTSKGFICKNAYEFPSDPTLDPSDYVPYLLVIKKIN